MKRIFKITVALLLLLQSDPSISSELETKALSPLPCGSIKPEGWLKYELETMTEGLVGRLYETSEFLVPGNGWLDANGEIGWEEQPYWLRSFIKLAVLTGNRRCLEVSKEWIEKILATQDEDGWYGPQYLKSSPVISGNEVKGYVNDIWGHMIMSEALLSWYEYTGDKRILDLLDRFFIYCNSLEGDELIRSIRKAAPSGDFHIGNGKIPNWHWSVQHSRSGDMVPVLFRMYELTGKHVYLSLSDRMMASLRSPGALFLDQHTVNFAQKISYWTVYWRRSHNVADYKNAYYWYDLHMAEWGQMPRGIYAADENFRIGCTDPRYGCESCSWAELTRSFQLISDVTGDTRWADRNEDIVFNHASAAYTPDWKELHYITAANQVSCDVMTDHNYYNSGPMAAYSSRNFRCCRHNAALTYPLFCENLVKRAEDGALVFWMYAPCSGETEDASWKLETAYPFRETAELDIQLKKNTVLRFRVPAWATSFEVKVGKASYSAAPGRLAELILKKGRHTLHLAMEAGCSYFFWPRNGGVSVDRGPLTYSLAIGEKYNQVPEPRKVGGSLIWVEPESTEGRNRGKMTEVTPTTPWNYGLDVSVQPVYRELEVRDGVFQSKNAPCEIIVKGRKVNEWILQDGQSAELQRSVALTNEPLQDLRFVPLCCQRLRLSVLPQVTDNPEYGRVWTVPASSTKRSERRARPIN